MVGHDGAATFADDVRMRDLLGVANIGDVIDDVVGVFLECVVGGTVKSRPASIIIHAQAAADIEALDLETHFVEFGVKASGLLNGAFDDENVRDLGANVEVKQFERFSALSMSVATSNSAVLRPNLAFSPPLSAQRPPPLLRRRARMPIK